MKPLSSLLLIAFAAISISSCKKASQNAVVPASYFKATVTTKGQTNAFTATKTNAGYYPGPPNALSISGIAGTQEIDLGLAPYTLGQTQIFDFHSGISIATWKPTGQFLINNPTSKYGTATIMTASNNFMTGTFNFTCNDSTKITGTFGASLPSN